MFLCEVAANQLQQSKGCYGVSHVLGSRASERGTVTTEQVQLGIGVRVQL